MEVFKWKNPSGRQTRVERTNKVPRASDASDRVQSSSARNRGGGQWDGTRYARTGRRATRKVVSDPRKVVSADAQHPPATRFASGRSHCSIRVDQ